MLRSRAAVAALVFLVAQAGSVLASTASPDRREAWMPDVARRIEELNERQQRSVEEAAELERRDLAGGQWWRELAVAPATQAAPGQERRR